MASDEFQEQLDNDGMDAGEAGYLEGFEAEQPEEEEEKEKVLDDFEN
jgi:hypothetical protein